MGRVVIFLLRRDLQTKAARENEILVRRKSSHTIPVNPLCLLPADPSHCSIHRGCIETVRVLDSFGSRCKSRQTTCNRGDKIVAFEAIAACAAPSELEATVRETLSPAVRLVCGPRRRFGVPVVRRARQTPRSCRRKRRPATGCFSRSPVASAWPQR